MQGARRETGSRRRGIEGAPTQALAWYAKGAASGSAQSSCCRGGQQGSSRHSSNTVTLQTMHGRCSVECPPIYSVEHGRHTAAAGSQSLLPSRFRIREEVGAAGSFIDLLQKSGKMVGPVAARVQCCASRVIL